MNKKRACAIVFLVVGITCFAESFDFAQYERRENGQWEQGVAAAAYVPIDSATFEKMDAPTLSYFIQAAWALTPTGTIDKMDKKTEWLCSEALGAWEIEDDECYIIITLNSYTAKEGKVFLVRIEDNGESYRWIGVNIQYSQGESDE